MSYSKGESEIQAKECDTESCQLMQFPLPNHDSPDLTSLFVANNNSSGAYDNGATEICLRLHNHPLSIHNDADITTNNMQAYNEILCEGCVRPISVPFYSCSKCNFFLHCFCAELPKELHCPHDPGHLIKVKKYKSYYDYFRCTFCLRCCNELMHQCESCNLTLDMACASNLIPSRIKHNSHVHPLVRSHLGNLECNACRGRGTGKSHTYSCNECSFNLCIICVHYPGSVSHEYDIHPILLMYPPIKDHPSDFICEICEKDINPRNWMYQ